jgi:hypothetical protein
LLPPHDARYISQAKLNALKPTLFLSGRQHANEVSSTSHMLRLGELLATDTSYTRLLDDVNVVLHPITNPDGAQLAYEMQLETPDFMLHAGYLGALGVDVTAGSNSPDPVYPEIGCGRSSPATWLPDIFMNLHGYPSHEWVQYFAGYSAWVRSRTGAQRELVGCRAAGSSPGSRGYTTREHPRVQSRAVRAARYDYRVDHGTARRRGDEPAHVCALREIRPPGCRELPRVLPQRHARLPGRCAAGELGTGVNSRRITWFSTTTEAPDETARGEWLELVASAGLAHTQRSSAIWPRDRIAWSATRRSTGTPCCAA